MNRICLSRVNFSRISFRYASFTIVLLFFAQAELSLWGFSQRGLTLAFFLVYLNLGNGLIPLFMSSYCAPIGQA